jgi:(p)ppGpp synthase/HD superfamily hydrolase
MADLFDAIEFAAHAHRGQYRKRSRIPYIIHPLNVARILIDCGASDEMVIAGVLHDVVEDSQVALADLRAQFGEAVALLVNALTEPNHHGPWEKRKQATLDFLENAPQEVLLLELADKLDNVRWIRHDLEREGPDVWTRFTHGRDQQKWYHQKLAALFLRRVESECGKVLAREFDMNVRELFVESKSENGDVTE